VTALINAPLGQSASGKTTLFELILGARETADASILVNGQDAAKLFRWMPMLGTVYLSVPRPRCEHKGRRGYRGSGREKHKGAIAARQLKTLPI
jgi:ABC-type cobalamin/Fe3+-siderophores transport system ATPase subunit